jgi:hypothetical protein
VAGVLAAMAIGAGALALGGGGPRVAAVRALVPSRAAGGVRESGAMDVAALGRMGADGVFLVTVTGVRCGVPAVGRARAAGRFCLVGVSVENAGHHTQVLDGAAQRVVDTRGRAYPVAGRAEAFLADPWGEAIPPGRTVRGVLPFDVPARTRLSALVMHESATSRGARVPLI